MPEKFKKGDVVYLNSQPDILCTVTKVFESFDDDCTIFIVWIDEYKKDRRLNVPPEAITLAKQEKIDKTD